MRGPGLPLTLRFFKGGGSFSSPALLPGNKRGVFLGLSADGRTGRKNRFHSSAAIPPRGTEKRGIIFRFRLASETKK